MEKIKTQANEVVCTSIGEEENGRMWLTGRNPFFDIVFANSNFEPCYHLYLPTNIVELLPCLEVPTTLQHGGKTWHVIYKGNCNRPSFRPGWKDFIVENKLQLRDICIFELMENTVTKLRFHVIILRNQDLPPELKDAPDSSDEQVIEID